MNDTMAKATGGGRLFCLVPSRAKVRRGLNFSVQTRTGLLRLRKEMDLFSNLRPGTTALDALADFSSLKDRARRRASDINDRRELTSVVYFGDRRIFEEGNRARRHQYAALTESEIDRVARSAFELCTSSGQQSLLDGKSQRSGKRHLVAR